MPGPGWYGDPAREHRARYWDGGVWTGHVADGPAGVESWGRPRPARKSSRAVRTTLCALGVALGLVVVAGVGVGVYQYRHRHDLSSAGKQLLKESPFYLDASAVLPGFTALDTKELGFDAKKLGLEARIAEPAAYRSAESGEAVVLLMGVDSTATDKGAERSQLTDSYLERQLRSGLKRGERISDVQWSDPRLGDRSRLATFALSNQSLVAGVQALVVLEPRGDDLVAFAVFTLFKPDAGPAVDVTTIAKQLLANLHAGR